MSNLVYLFILIAVVVAMVILRMPKRRNDQLIFPYSSKEFLMSPAERSFLGVLDQVLANNGYRVFAQVRLADVVQVDKDLKRAVWQSAFNTISRKHVDFVICRSDDMAILGVIELDDESHKQGKRKDRDQVVDKILEAADIPLVRIQAAATYAPNETRKLLSRQMGIEFADQCSKQGCSPIELPTSTDNGREGINDPIDLDQNEGPTCPKCGSLLLPRVAKKGKYQGQKFWGCSQFPKCKYVEKRACQRKQFVCY